MRDSFGIKLSRKREDATKVLDSRLLFDSSTFSVKPLYSGLIRSGTTSGTVIARHGLGYKPFFLFWRKERLSGTAPPATVLGAFSAQVNDNNVSLRIDEEKLLLGTTTTVDHYYAIWDINLDKPYTSPIEAPGKLGATSVNDDDFVFQVSQRSSAKPAITRDYSVNSESQPLLVASVTQHKKLDELITQTISFDHNLGYPPMFFVFGKNTTQPAIEGYNLFEFAPSSSNGATASVDEVSFAMSMFSTFVFTVVLFRDPIL